MQIGAMNNPRRDLLEEIEWFGQHDFDFIDLTLEMPEAAPEILNYDRVQERLARYGMDIVCHGAPYLPLDSPSPKVRQAALDELRRSIDAAAELKSSLLTIHFMGWPSYLNEQEGYEYYRQMLDILCRHAAGQNVEIAMENSPRNEHQLKYFREIYARVPNLKLLLDVSHANLGVVKNLTSEYLFALADRLVHVHISDNDGQEDSHLPLGAAKRGGIRWQREFRHLKSFRYNSTFTMEIFSEDRRLLLWSRDRFREMWENA